MKTFRLAFGSGILGVVLSAAFLLLAPPPPLHADDVNGSGWKGTSLTSGTAFWNNTGNWDSSAPSSGERNLFFGNAWVTAGRTGATTAYNNISSYSGYHITFENIASPVTFTLTGNAITLFDWGGVDPGIFNNSSIVQNVNLALTLNGQNGGNRAELDPTNGDLSMGSTVDLAGTTALQIYGNNGHTITFNEVLSSSGNSGNNTVTNESNNIVVYKAANTYAGDTFILAGKLQFDTNGSANSSSMRLGDTSGTNNAEIDLIGASGGQTISSVINPRSGSSGTLAVSSQNTSGTNTLSGHFGLDHALTVTQAGGGNLILSSSYTGSTTTGIDIKGNTITFNGAGNVSVTGGIYNSTGSGKVNYAGTGMLTLSASNGYSNETDIDTGTVGIGNNNALGTSTVYVGNGALQGSNAALYINTGGLTVSNAINTNSSTGGLRTIGGTFASGTSTYSGQLNVNTYNHVVLTSGSGGTVTFNLITSSTTNNPVAVSGTGGTVILAGSSDNLNLGLTVNSGTVVLAKTVAGGTHAVGTGFTVNTGATVQLAGGGGDQIYDGANSTVNSGGVFDMKDRSETLAALNLNGTGINNGGALINSGTATAILTASNGIVLQSNSTIGAANATARVQTSSVISGTGFSLTKVGAGILDLGGTSTYSGGTSLNAGTTLVDADSTGAVASPTGGALGTGTLILNGGAIRAGTATLVGRTVNNALMIAADTTITTSVVPANDQALTFSGATTISGASRTLTSNSRADSNFDGVIGDGGNALGLSFNATSTGKFVLSGSNTYSGGTTVIGGTLQIGNASALGAVGGALTVNAGALDLNGNSVGVGALTGSSGAIITSNTTGSVTLTGSTNSSTTYAGTINNGSGTVGLVKTGTGTLTLTGINNYSGGTILTLGAIVAGNNSAFGSGLMTLNGGTLMSDDNSRALANNIIINMIGGQVSGNYDLEFSGTASGTGTLTVNVGPTNKVKIKPTTPDSFAPDTIKVTGGTLLLGGSNKIGNSTKINLNGGTFATGGNDETVGALTLSADSTIDLSNTGTMRFSSLTADTSGQTLALLNWTSGASHLVFTNSVSADTTFLSDVSFNGIVGAQQISFGGGGYELVPIPEPATMIGALAFAGLIVLRERKRIYGFTSVWRRTGFKS